MFEDDPTAQDFDTNGIYLPPHTEVIVDKDVGIDLRPPREFKTYRERNGRVHPDDVFKTLLTNTFQPSKAK
jgi:hypothetical protein